ncbi:MAG: hypothetical protein ACE5G8_04295, partial [Anaerolineae bacterium]
MAYTLIKGVYHIVGYSPDGDSIKFRANNNARWDKIITDHRETFEEKLAAENGVITLRLQGIDALETHYSPPTLRTPKDLARSNPGALQKPEPGGHKQPSKFGQLATAEFLRLLGVNNVEWRSFGKNTWISNAWIQKRGKEVCVDSKHQDNIPGYIVTDDVEKNGRPIAWVFPGSARERDGSTITADRLADRLEQSANYHLLQKGLVYPYF